MKKQTKSQKALQQTPTPGTDQHKDSRKFPIVGIGASAGGLESLTAFFSNMPATSGMAFVVIQHLDPNHKTLLVDLLQAKTEMKVVSAQENMRVEPDHVYIIPPNKRISVENESLHLSELQKEHGIPLPIDFFFSSLAKDRNEQSVGIILSGMGSDGSHGLISIKRRAGLALVQEPTTAKFDSMPNNAIKAVDVDIVAPADQLPAKLINLIQHPKKPDTAGDEQRDSGSLDQIIRLIRHHTDHDFSQYKKNTLFRRVEKRMGVHQIGKITSYVTFLRDHPAEVVILSKEMLIGVTTFFRDPAVWEYLKEVALPEFLAEIPDGYTLRAWVPGCYTGEEAYSLAIVIREILEELPRERDISVQIFATDLDNVAIEKARKGLFPSTIVSDIEAGRLRRFFTLVNNQYQANSKIRNMLLFATHNVVNDPPFTRLDLVSCRNLLIYLDSALQKKLLGLFHFGLKPGGLLVLGTSETNGDNHELFPPVEPRLKLYKRSGQPEREKITTFESSFFSGKQKGHEPPVSRQIIEDLQNQTDQLVLQQYSPAGVLANSNGEIIYITGSPGKYLEPPSGKANFNLFAMARDGLRNELPLAFRQALKSYKKIELSGIRMSTRGDRPHMADVILQQIENPLSLRGKILVVFKDIPEHLQDLPSTEGKETKPSHSEETERRFSDLKEELRLTREKMHSSQEELNLANDELQSTNEELQSTNEELTTSKEEMQSLNEELHTTNAELQNKVNETIGANDDMHNLMNSIDIAALFLDHDLNIRQFTAPATDIFKLIHTDIGRQFTDLASSLFYPEMYDDSKKVLHTHTSIKKEVSTKDSKWYSLRMMPYRTLEGKIDGLVITFIDVTQSKKEEKAMLEYQAMLRSLIHEVPGVVISLSNAGKIIEFNPGAEKLFECKREDVIARKYVDLFVADADKKDVETALTKLQEGTTPTSYINHVKTMEGKELTIKWSGHRLYDSSGKISEVITIGKNITKSLQQHEK